MEKDEMVGHKRYANPARSLNMPYSLGNIEFGWQSSHEAHRGALGQSPEERRSSKQQKFGETLAPFEWT